MSYTEPKVDNLNLLHDMIGYIMSVGSLLMKPEVSVLAVAMTTAGAVTTAFKSVDFSNMEEGGYQGEFNKITDAAWNYAWEYNNMDLLAGSSFKKRKAPGIPKWNWESVTKNTSANKTLLMAARRETRHAVEDALKKADLRWDEMWNDDRISAASDKITRDFFVKLYMLIGNNKDLQPYRDRTVLLERMKAICESLDRQRQDHEELSAEIRLMRQSLELIISLLQKETGSKDDASVVPEIDVAVMNSVRKLAEGVWVNWKTGCLATNMESAMSDFGPDEVDMLSPDELRLLSILVQGEGAIVSWEELSVRRKVGEAIQDIVRRGPDDNNPSRMRMMVEASRQRMSDDGMDTVEARKVVDTLTTSHPQLKKIIMLEDKGCRVKLYTIVESEDTYLYDTFSAVRAFSRDKDWVAIDNYKVQKNQRKTPCSDAKDIQAWLRLYYDQVCHSFDNDLSNARGGGDQGSDIFGDYKLVQAYVNAYVTEDPIRDDEYDDEGEEAAYKIEDRIEAESRKTYDDAAETEEKINAEGETDDESEDIKTTDVGKDEDESNDGDKDEGKDENEDYDSEVMLDYIEEWYCLKENNSSSGRSAEATSGKTMPIKFGRVLVLHGQPGDGKTTFCKKAVYAHCKEGWLKKASHVLWFSLNAQDNLLKSEDNLNLDYAVCLKNDQNKYLAHKNHLRNALIILDGYDELSDDLDSIRIEDADSRTDRFKAFCSLARRFARNNHLNIVITSRTMCVKDELEEIEDEVADVASFAPMAVAQQEALVDRMIELDKAHGKDINPLEAYRNDVLPKLREKKNLKGLLRIPSLFRMIVTTRFADKDNAHTFADLFGDLFHNLMDYKGTGSEKEGKLLLKYEELASRVFYHGTDVCPFSKKDGLEEERELVYKFLTKQGSSEEGYLGFLHRSFYQYFLARFIVSKIRHFGGAVRKAETLSADSRLLSECAERTESDFREFFVIMSARRLNDPFMWSLVRQLTEAAIRRDIEKAQKKQGGQKRRDKNIEKREKTYNKEKASRIPLTRIDTDDIKAVLKLLNKDMIVVKSMAEGLRQESPYERKSGTEKGYVIETENAIFNLVCLCAAAEKSIHRVLGEEHKRENQILYGGKGEEGLVNVCRLLRSGNYTGIYLEGLNLDGCDLRNASFDGAYLRGASLRGADLSGAQLVGAHMEEKKQLKVRAADLTRARLSASNLTTASMMGAILTGATLSYADLSRANMKEAHLEGAVLKGANLEKADLRDAVLTNEADLSDAGQPEGNRSDADKGEARITCRTDFSEANLTKARLQRAKLQGVKLEKACLTAAHLDGAVLSGADLRTAHLEAATMIDTYLEEANLQWASLDNVYMKLAHMKGAKLDDASLKAAYLAGAELEGVSWEGADLEGVLVTESQLAYIRQQDAAAMPDTIQAKLERLREDIRKGKRHVLFGRYPQGEDGEIKPLHWRVLAVDGSCNQALIITERLIDCKPFNESLKPVNWNESDLRKWMNGTFIDTAFCEEEKLSIAEKTIPNPDNRRYNTKGCMDTDDRVFALSIDEAKRLFDSSEDRKAAVTPYAKKRGSWTHSDYKLRNGEETGWWWLRSPGHDSHGAAFVHGGGAVIEYGNNVNLSAVSVRPALWLHL